jgi:hypothetical protein
MKQTAVEWLHEKLATSELEDMQTNINLWFKQAKEIEKQQIIDCGNTCAFKQHLHSDRINKMSMDELKQYDI